jgi:mono/diheme cytochrome c family protein
LRILAAIPSLALTLAACVSPPEPAFTSDPVVARGQEIARTYCAACHGIGRYDSSKHRDAIPFRKLSELYPVSDLGEAFAEGLMTGHEDMPEVKLPPQDVAAMIAYLEAIQLKPRLGDDEPSRPGNQNKP